MEKADFGIVANSQSGLEMIYRNKPVLVCANPYYAVDKFCLRATDEQTIEVQLKKLIDGWCAEKKHLTIAKQYLCGLIFHHLCLRDKASVWQRLDNITHCNEKKNQSMLLLANNKHQDMVVMPNAKIGRVVIDLPESELKNKNILVIGAGSFSQHLALSTSIDFSFCSDLPADCLMTVNNMPVHPLTNELVIRHDVILISWPLDKCEAFLSTMMEHNLIRDKTIFFVDKRQDVHECKFKFTPISPEYYK